MSNISIIRNYDTTEGDDCSYISVDKKKVNTIRDLVIEANETFKNKTYIRYHIENELYSITFEEMLSICEVYETWMHNEMENKVKDTGRCIHIGILGIGSLNYYIAFLGTMFSGNMTIPIDPNLDIDTLTYCINHGDVDVIFYETKFQSKIDILKERCPNVKEYILLEPTNNNENEQDNNSEEISNLSTILNNTKNQEIVKDVKKDDNALMIYTSGTTGKKKGVVLTHENIIDKLFSTFNFKGNQTEIYLCVLPLYHIFSSNDFLFSLRFGFNVCFDFDVSKLVKSLQLFQPTKASLVPLLTKNLLNIINMNIRDHPELSAEEAKKQIIGENFYKIQSGGGFLSEELTNGFNKLGILVGQGYGLTETAGKASISDFNPKKIASVGRVAPNSEIRIFDGEIQIKSKAVMKEYYKDPELTKEAFTEDGWLHTGDIGYFDEDGYLFLVGRKKNLIILSNGENISPEALETLYANEALIQEIIVYGSDDVLCAEVYPNFKYADVNNISRDNIKETVWNIIETKNKDLPSYERIVKLSIRNEPFIKTASKKIIRSEFMKELELREKNKNVQQKEIKKPTNEIQSKLYDIAVHALGSIKDFGVDSNFYDFGLDSFSCTIIMNDIRKKFNIPISLHDVVHNSSVMELEKYILEYKKDENEEIVDLSKRDVYPTTTMQKMCFPEYGGSTHGNVQSLFILHEDIDLHKLKASIEKLIDINCELKATIHLDEEGKYKNYRHDERKADIKITKITDKEWMEVKKGLLYPYNFVEEELLYHIEIFETETHNYLYFDISHLICDGVSYKILIDDLTDIYCGKPVEPKDYSFYEYALERNCNALQTYLNERKYFVNLLSGITLRGNPFVRRDAYNNDPNKDSRFVKRPYEDGRIVGTLEKIDLEKFESFCKDHSITENSLFFVAVGHALNIYENVKDIAISSIHNGRISDKYKRVCGYLATFYELRYTEVENETVIDSIHRVGKQIMETMCKQHGFMQRNCIFFQYQDRIHEYKSLCGKPVVQEIIPIQSPFFQLGVFKRDNGFKYLAAFWDNIYEAVQVEKFIHIVEDIVVAIVNGVTYIKDLRNSICEDNLTSKRVTSIEELNEAIGKKYIWCDDEKNTYVNTYILSNELDRQVIGGWGDLYIEENEYIKVKDTDIIDNPFGKGKLYKTGFTGRFIPDEKRSINVLENDCRIIMWGFSGYERYGNINITEKTLAEYPGIEKAYSEIKYMDDKFNIISHIYSKNELDKVKINDYLKSKLEERYIPVDIIFHKLE